MDKSPMPILTMDNILKFWNKVNLIYLSDKDACWPWLGSKDHCDNRGTFRVKLKMYKAPRISYWMHYHKDPGELEVCHECNNPPCVNPKHLFLGTTAENQKHASLEGRRPLGNRAVLEEHLVLKIRQLSLSCTNKQLSSMFDVSESTISSVINYHTWQHV